MKFCPAAKLERALISGKSDPKLAYDYDIRDGTICALACIAATIRAIFREFANDTSHDNVIWILITRITKNSAYSVRRFIAP